MNFADLAEMINGPDRIATLGTAGADGFPNTAVIGSAWIKHDQEVWIGLGDNRTAHNLQSNPKAVLAVFRPGTTVLDWKGGRLYLELDAMENEGERFDRMVEHIRSTAGRLAARSIHQLALFRISDIRPLAELGRLRK